MANYGKHVSKAQNAPQRVKDREDQVKNSAGGYVYSVDGWNQLNRFLILGSEGGTYYASERKLTLQNVKNIVQLIKEDGKKVVDTVVEISDQGRAPKNDPALFVMALCLTSDKDEVKQYAINNLNKVARIATHLFTFADYCNDLRRWGRSLRRAIANWYNAKEVDQLAYQVCKYQSRTKEGSQTWSHLDLIRKSHIKPRTKGHSDVINYIRTGWTDEQLKEFVPSKDNAFNYIYAHEKAKRATNVNEIVELINNYNLARESIPTNFLNDAEVWKAMLPKMPLTAMIRNLATMTKNGVLGSLSKYNNVVVDKLLDEEGLKQARIHPIQILSAMRTYASGRGFRGSNTWTPVQSIVDAMNDSFYLAFNGLKPTGKNILVAVDCSGSMSAAAGGVDNLTARDIAAAIAMAVVKVEKNYVITGFGTGSGHKRNLSMSHDIAPLSISPKMRLDTVINTMENFSWGGTDCALPMIYAKSENLKVDTFVVITDSETWAGKIKPDAALRDYRKSSGIQNAKLIVLATTSTRFTIADPNDKYMLDICGFDSSVPQIMNEFILDRI